ncbi:MAG: RDD family protein [Bacteroidetes bacterium]|nr:RDD family protein [Bacteroidota bacterium]
MVTPADKVIRFGNYIIDVIVFLMLFMLHVVVIEAVFHTKADPDSPWLTIYYLMLLFGYFFIFEYFFGKTPGKFLTKTRVVDMNGEWPGGKKLLIRTLCRLIPFDNFSFLFSAGWHDMLSGTVVVKD